VRPLVLKFLLIFIPSIIILSALSLTVNYFFKHSELRVLQAQQSNLVRLAADNLADELESVVSDLKLLASDENLLSFIESGNQIDYQRTQNAFLRTSDMRKMYDQIRYLDASGKEVIRVNFCEGSPKTVPASKLQNKKGRYYFDESMSLNDGQIFISPFDLNLERGEIEQPLKPMIRLSTPVFNKKGNKTGIVLLNYFGKRILHKIQQQETNSPAHLLMVNAEGYWLKGRAKDQEWGFMYPDRQDQTFKKQLPVAWIHVHDANSGQFECADGLFTYHVIHLAENISYVQGSTVTPFSPIKWKLISWIPEAKLNKLTNVLMQSLIFINLVLIFLLAIISWVFAHTIIKKQNAEAELRQQEKFSGVLEMAGAASHELNQPLQTASNYTDILLEKNKANPDIYDQLNKVKKQIEKLGQITNRLMHMTSYKTKEYADGSQIIDIEESSQK